MNFEERFKKFCEVYLIYSEQNFANHDKEIR